MKCLKIFYCFAWIYNYFIKLEQNPEDYYKKIKSIAKLKKSASILDVGGGTGLIASYFSKDVKRVVVLDPSEKMLAKIKSPKIEKVVGVAQNMKFKNSTFDLIYCVNSFHHFTNSCSKNEYTKTTDLCIKKLLQVLKPKGVLIIIEFDVKKWRGRLVEFCENKIMQFESNFYSRKKIKKLFSYYSVNINIFNLDKSCYIVKISKTK